MGKSVLTNKYQYIFPYDITEDGARTYKSDGRKEWRENNVLHRIGGPAFMKNNTQKWWENGRLHRLDGPAAIYGKDFNEWYVKGKHITPQLVKACADNDISFDHKKWTDRDWVWFRLWVSQF